MKLRELKLTSSSVVAAQTTVTFVLTWTDGPGDVSFRGQFGEGDTPQVLQQPSVSPLSMVRVYNTPGRYVASFFASEGSVSGRGEGVYGGKGWLMGGREGLWGERRVNGGRGFMGGEGLRGEEG